MKKIIKTILFRYLLFILIVGILLGIISFILFKPKNQTGLINYINLINNGHYDYFKGFATSLIYNTKNSFYIWILGIVFILCPLNILIIGYKGISLGYTISSLIYTFKFKGIIYSLIMGISSLLNIFIYILLCYYSINFAIKSFNAYRNNRQINYKSFTINYIYIYCFIIMMLIVSSLIEIYLCSNLIRFVV